MSTGEWAHPLLRSKERGPPITLEPTSPQGLQVINNEASGEGHRRGRVSHLMLGIVPSAFFADVASSARPQPSHAGSPGRLCPTPHQLWLNFWCLLHLLPWSQSVEAAVRPSVREAWLLPHLSFSPPHATPSQG